MLFYFTATGNSLYAAKQLDDVRISIAQAIHGKEKRYQADRIGIVCPVFGHEVPPLVKEFLSGAEFDTDYFYVVLTYGNRHGGACELVRKLLEGLGIHLAYINVLLMADNFLPAFDMDEQKKMDKKVDEHLAQIREDIENRKRFFSPVTDADRAAHREYLDRVLGMPENALANAYYITDACMGCEICTKVCPKKCFLVEKQKSIWNPKGCMMCMACIHACPTKAIQMRGQEKNREARYRNENISICEIVDANNQWKEK